VLVLVSLYALATFILLARSMACVLFSIKGGMARVFVIFGLELALYYAVKLARRDFWYWVPLYGAPGLVLSFLIRLIMKVVGDWAAIVQFRHANEIGGFYFSFR
jgi:hypothetical protein